MGGKELKTSKVNKTDYLYVSHRIEGTNTTQMVRSMLSMINSGNPNTWETGGS